MRLAVFSMLLSEWAHLEQSNLKVFNGRYKFIFKRMDIFYSNSNPVVALGRLPIRNFTKSAVWQFGLWL